MSQAPGKLLSGKQRWLAKKLQLFVKTPLLNTVIPEKVFVLWGVATLV